MQNTIVYFIIFLFLFSSYASFLNQEDGQYHRSHMKDDLWIFDKEILN